MLVSCADADGATQRCHVLEFALVPDRFVGTGDTFAALLTSRVRAAPLSDTALVAAARWSIAVLLGLLRDTAAHAPRVEGWQELRMCNLAAHVGAADLDLVTVGNEEVHVMASSV
jgi:pyridoxal/pyridoxine/pyridoxamine kinase